MKYTFTIGEQRLCFQVGTGPEAMPAPVPSPEKRPGEGTVLLDTSTRTHGVIERTQKETQEVMNRLNNPLNLPLPADATKLFFNITIVKAREAREGADAGRNPNEGEKTPDADEARVASVVNDSLKLTSFFIDIQNGRATHQTPGAEQEALQNKIRVEYKELPPALRQEALANINAKIDEIMRDAGYTGSVPVVTESIMLCEGQVLGASAEIGKKQAETRGEQLKQQIDAAAEKFSKARTPGEQIAALIQLVGTAFTYIKCAFDGTFDQKISQVDKLGDTKKTDPDKKDTVFKADAKKTVDTKLKEGGEPKTVKEMKDKLVTVKDNTEKERQDTAQNIKDVTEDAGKARKEKMDGEKNIAELGMAMSEEKAKKSPDTDEITRMDVQLTALKMTVNTAEKKADALAKMQKDMEAKQKGVEEQLKEIDDRLKKLESAGSLIRSTFEQAQQKLAENGVKNKDNITWKDIDPQIDGSVVIRGANAKLIEQINTDCEKRRVEPPPAIESNKEFDVALSKDMLQRVYSIEPPATPAS